jgi:hypothetical protein
MMSLILLARITDRSAGFSLRRMRLVWISSDGASATVKAVAIGVKKWAPIDNRDFTSLDFALSRRCERSYSCQANGELVRHLP